jgi:protein-S-isoprenylcysteine O-methyltransferase Ste14
VAGLRLPSLGPHGEGWVAGQLVLLAAVVGAGFVGPRWPWGPLPLVLGVVLVVAGLALALAGIAGLGSSLTPLPRPKEDASLREDGVFGLARHPIYGGVLVAALGWSLATRPLALLPTVLAELFLELKSRREEAWLLERFPGYDGYRRRVRWRFVPGIR